MGPLASLEFSFTPLTHFGLPFHAPPEASRMWCIAIAWLAPHLKFFQTCEEKVNTPDSFVKAKKAPRKLPSCFQQGMGESGLPDMTFGGKVYYCSHRDDCNFICNQLRYVRINNQSKNFQLHCN